MCQCKVFSNSIRMLYSDIFQLYIYDLIVLDQNSMVAVYWILSTSISWLSLRRKNEINIETVCRDNRCGLYCICIFNVILIYTNSRCWWWFHGSVINTGFCRYIDTDSQACTWKVTCMQQGVSLMFITTII